jgi:ParB family chromosome partitioning protein
MFVEMEKIVVDDRIRKDYGNLQELADNISENTLMNPPVVMPNGDGTYTLIAGERRLRAMRDILGYMQTEVNVVTPRDAEQMLLMEISENECRKEFTMTERLDYAAKIKAVESAKAKERQGTRTDLAQDFVQSERKPCACG